MTDASNDADTDRPGLVLAVCATLVYCATTSTVVVGGDNGEFITLFAEGGVAHPSGYPATVLWLRLWSWLPLDVPAQGAAVAMALLGGFATYGVWRAARSFGASTTGAGVATALYAFGPGAWVQSTHAEVFAMHAALAAGIVAFAGPRARVRGVVRVGALAALAGLGLANNHTLVGLAPIGLYGVALGLREASGSVRAWAAGPVGFAIGSLPQLQLVLAGRSPGARWAWGDTSTADGLWHHLLRRDFGTFQLGIYEGGDNLPLRHVELLMTSIVEHYLYVGGIVALVGVVSILRRSGEPELEARDRWGHGMLALSFALIGPVLLSRFNLAPDGVALHVVERFHLVPALLVAPWVAVGFDRVLAPLTPRLPAIATAVAVAYISVVARFDEVREHHRPTVEFYLRNIVSSVPDGAVVLGTGDHRLYGFLYLERALGKMGGVTYVDARMLLHPWYADRIEDAIGGPVQGVDHEAATVDTVALIRGLHADGRPVYLTNVFSERIPAAIPLIPSGVLLEARAPGAPPLTLVEVAERHQAMMQRYVIEADPPLRDTWGGLVHDDYARAWNDLADALRAAGMTEAAETFAENAQRVRPVAPEPFWR